MFAIQNIKTGKFVYGTDYRYGKFPHQRTSTNQMVTYDTLWYAKRNFYYRRCGKNYRVVKLKPVEVEQVIPFNTDCEYQETDEDWEEFVKS